MDKENESCKLKLTPKKVYNRQENKKICRLCVCEVTRFGRIFSKAGKAKHLSSKIAKITNINILETDDLSDILCQKCERFLDSVVKFQTECQFNQKKLLQACSIKRVTSPPAHPLTKSSTVLNDTRSITTGSKKQLLFGSLESTNTLNEMSINIIDKTLISPQPITRFVSVQHITTTSTPVNVTVRCSESIFSSVKDVHLSQPLSLPEISKLSRSLETRIPSAVGEIISNIPNLFYAVKNIISRQINISCRNLCKKVDGSILYNNDYNGMSELDFQLIWNELCEHNSYFIDILNSLSGQCYSIENIPPNIQVKYCFIYSILMNTRWQSLSLVQRVNTILMVDGGCSKKVYIQLLL